MYSDIIFMCKALAVYILSLSPIRGSLTFIVTNYPQQTTRIHYYALLLGEPGPFHFNPYIREERTAKSLLDSIVIIWPLTLVIE